MTCVEVNARVSVVVVAGIVSFKRPAQLVMFVKLMTVEEENDCASRGPVAVRETLSVSSERNFRGALSSGTRCKKLSSNGLSIAKSSQILIRDNIP